MKLHSSHALRVRSCFVSGSFFNFFKAPSIPPSTRMQASENICDDRTGLSFWHSIDNLGDLSKNQPQTIFISFRLRTPIPASSPTVK